MPTARPLFATISATSHADFKGVLPAVLEELCGKSAADHLSYQGDDDERDGEPQKIQREAVERDIQPDTCEEHGSEQHIGAYIHLARDVFRVAQVAQDYSCDVSAGDVSNTEERFSAVSHQEAQHQTEYRNTALMIELLVQ